MARVGGGRAPGRGGAESALGVQQELAGLGDLLSIRKAGENLHQALEGDPRLDHPRFSAGIVTYPHPAVSQTEELYAMAEAALMRGKAQSGERIGVAV